MGFVNEYVSDEDIEKYDLRGIWDKYYPLRKGRYFGGNRPHWTVDKNINTFITVQCTLDQLFNLLLVRNIGRNRHAFPA